MKIKFFIKLFFFFLLINLASKSLKAEGLKRVSSLPALDSVKVIDKETKKKEEVKEIPKSKPQKRPEPVKPDIKRPNNIRPKGIKPGQMNRPGAKGLGKKN